MTVKELIEKLKTFDENVEVFCAEADNIDHYNYDYTFGDGVTNDFVIEEGYMNTKGSFIRDFECDRKAICIHG